MNLSKFSKKNTVALILIVLLVLSFQNCGNSSFQNSTGTANLNSNSDFDPPVEDSQFREGLDFALMSLTPGENSLKTEFSLSRNNSSYTVTNGSIQSRCTFENPNAAGELLQILEVSSLQLPQDANLDLEICEDSEDRSLFYMVGQQSPVFLVFKDDIENCHSGDVQSLIDLNKRVFIVENLLHDDVEALIESVLQDVNNGEVCDRVNFTIETQSFN